MKKISLIGAGNIGTILAHSISRKNLGNIVLIDKVDGLAEGKCLDLSQSLVIDGIDLSVVGSNDVSRIKDSDAIIITAGIPRKPGMSRDDLIETNFKVMSSIGEAIKHHSPNSFVICVTNPLDAMVWSLKEVSGLKKNMILGMAGILDSARFKFFLSELLQVSVCNIDTLVLGGHGDTMVPLLDYTTISGIPLKEYLKLKNIDQDPIDKIVNRTRNGGGEIVALMKNSSAFYSPALSAIEMLESFINDQKKVLPCSAFLDGEYGVSDLCVGVPVRIGSNGVEEIIKLNLTKDEEIQFKNSVNAVRDLTDKCKKLLV
ncbi:MAG: malate dehydrogenase [Rickettsiales bacterium]|nr:malate dehydrogenase [Rickettsiales bacterium]